MLTQLERVTTSSILTKADVAHLVGLPADAVHRWSARNASGRPSIITQGRRGHGPNPPTIPLLGLSEASLMKHLTTELKKGPRKVASAVRDAKDDDPYCFAHEGFYTDGTDTFLSYLGGFERTKDRQRAIREVLAPYLRKLNFTDGVLQAFTVEELPSDRVVIDPRYRSGRPFLESSGVPVFTILDEIEDDVTPAQIAADFDIAEEVVRDVKRFRRHLAPVA